MIDRLHDVLPQLERLPPKTQEEIAAYIEALIEVLEHEAVARGRDRQDLPKAQAAEPWEDPVGACADLPDTMLQELDQLRHATPPTPPIEQL